MAVKCIYCLGYIEDFDNQWHNSCKEIMDSVVVEPEPKVVFQREYVFHDRTFNVWSDGKILRITSFGIIPFECEVKEDWFQNHFSHYPFTYDYEERLELFSYILIMIYCEKNYEDHVNYEGFMNRFEYMIHDLGDQNMRPLYLEKDPLIEPH